MEAEKRDFQASQGLLEDVMRKQAGSIEKAILEAVMNSVDAGGSYVDITLQEEFLKVKDDGEGLTEKDVRQYFEQFGYKDDDVEDKEFGKFRIGRGQIFNFGANVWRSRDNVMVVDLDNDEREVGIDGETTTVDTSGLSYSLIKDNEETEGCNILVDLYDEIEDISKAVNKTRNLIRYVGWVHDVTISINGESVTEDFAPGHETETGWYAVSEARFGTGINVFNQGAKVKNVSGTPKQIIAISKKDLDVNFARNDVLNTCDVAPVLLQEARDFCFQQLLEEDTFSNREREWMLEEATGDDEKFRAISSIPLFEDAKGNSWSLKELSGERITFKAGAGNMAKRIMNEKGIVVIDGAYGSQVKKLVEESEVVSYGEVVEREMKWEMREVDENDISKKRRENLELAREFLRELNMRMSVKPGHSQEKDVWKGSDGTVYIDRGYLNTRKQVFRTKGLMEVFRIACHEGTTQTGFESDYSFKSKYASKASRIGEVLYEFQNK